MIYILSKVSSRNYTLINCVDLKKMIKQTFVWWHKQTFGTFLKTFFW